MPGATHPAVAAMHIAVHAALASLIIAILISTLHISLDIYIIVELHFLCTQHFVIYPYAVD